MNDVTTQGSSKYLACEQKNTYLLLMASAGMMGAYTFNLRGGIFCNAQTANVVMMAIAFGKGQLWNALYFAIPISAYCLGAFLSEILPSPVKRFGLFRWDTLLIAVEMVLLLGIGFIPLRYPDQIVQVAINFIASMQYNTFRQAEGVPMATTFCTNHIRQIGIALAKILRKGDTSQKDRILVHAEMLSCFLAGGIALTILCSYFQERAIWLVMLPLSIVFCKLAYADIVLERGEMSRKPAGH